jgi:hypothetical protein
MKLCANCVEPAVYEYFTTPFCVAHLPRFLRNANADNVFPLPIVAAPALEEPPFLEELPNAGVPVETAPAGE